MIVKDLSTVTLNALVTNLSAATPEKPLTRQEIAYTANVARETVGELLTSLRLSGWLILEDERGCWLGSSFDEYKHWRSAMLIPAMLLLLQIDQAMARAAVTQFGAGREETG